MVSSITAFIMRGFGPPHQSEAPSRRAGRTGATVRRPDGRPKKAWLTKWRRAPTILTGLEVPHVTNDLAATARERALNYDLLGG